jgi:hypothetical protein
MHKIALTLLCATVGASCGVPPGDALSGPIASRAAALVQTYTPDGDTWAYPGWDYGVSRELRTNNIVTADVPKSILLHFPVNLGLVCPTLATALLRLTSAQLAGPLWVHPHPVLGAWAPGPTGGALALEGLVGQGHRLGSIAGHAAHGGKSYLRGPIWASGAAA